jgi:hypothetical protein
MAAFCRGRGAATIACRGSDDHIRRVAEAVALEKAKVESNIYTLRRPDYSAEEWRFLYLTTSSDLYLNSIRLVGFCGADGINWAIVTRMKEKNDYTRERFYGTFAKESYPFLHYMRPQFRFLVYYGRNNPRVNLADNLDRFFYDMEKVVSGDESVWGAPVVIDGVHVLPEVECLVPSWLRQEYFARTASLGLPAGQRYVYPGVRSPLLLPTDYIRKYIFFSYLQFSLGFVFVVVFKTGSLCYSLCSDVDRSKVPRPSDGRACPESAFPVLRSGRLWAGYCADSGCCEVSLHSTFVFYVLSCGSGFYVSLLLLFAGWFGLVVWYYLWWVVFIMLVSVVSMLGGLLHVHDNCFHQIEMIASIKLRHPLSFCRAICARTVVLVCVCFVS